MTETPSFFKEDRIHVPKIHNFEDGLIAVRDKVGSLLEQQKLVVVAINGSGPGVGKSTLAGEISKSFMSEGVPVGICSDADTFGTAVTQRQFYQKYFGDAERGIYVLEGMEPPHGRRTFANTDLRRLYDGVLKRGAKKFDGRVNKVDVWVALFSASVPFNSVTSWWDQPYDPFEDVIIRNEHARSS